MKDNEASQKDGGTEAGVNIGVKVEGDAGTKIKADVEAEVETRTEVDLELEEVPLPNSTKASKQNPKSLHTQTSKTPPEKSGSAPATSAHTAAHAAEHAPTPTQGHESFARPANEDDDGYDPWSDRPVKESFWEEDPWR